MTDNLTIHATGTGNLCLTAIAPKPWATVCADGTVEIDWDAVEQCANDPNGNRTLWAACKVVLAVRDGTAKSVGSKEVEWP